MASLAPAPRPPLWRNVRVLRIVGQIAFVFVVFVVLQQMYLNASFQLRQGGQDLSYDFLDIRAGFGIKEHVIEFRSTLPYRRAFLVGYTNAVAVAILGIVGASLMGLIVGVARLSPNWLVRKMAQVYVEFFRNTPLAVQVVFWWAGAFLVIPRLENAISIFGIAHFTNRGLGVPTISPQEQFGVWVLFVLAGFVASAFVYRWRTKVFEETGTASYRYLYALASIVIAGLAGYLILGDPFRFEVPQIGERNLIGGFQMSPEWGGLMVALIIYTGAFIGEIIRGSILAVEKGQKEAVQALGLRPSQQLRLVVLPQALRIAIPAINNQYLNLWKNTSLGFLIGFPELINISTTIINQAGNELQVFFLVIVAYLLTSLVLSALMNIVNRSVAFKGERS